MTFNVFEIGSNPKEINRHYIIFPELSFLKFLRTNFINFINLILNEDRRP